MEDAEQEILEVVIARDHAGEVFEVSSKLLQFHIVVRLDVVPTPHKLVECFLLALLASQHLRMPPGIIGLPQFF